MTRPIPEARLIRIIRRRSHPLRPRPAGVRPHLRRLPGIRAVLFDIYGTLFVSASGDIGSGNPGDARFADAVRRRHKLARARGVDVPEVDVRRIWRSLLGPASAPDIERRAVEYECLTNPVWPMPGLRTVIDRLRRRGLVLGIVSNAQFFTPLLFPALAGARLAELGFDPRACAWSWRERRAKPSPRLLGRALAALRRKHGIAPREVLVIGNDLLNDILPAARAGCRTALFAGDQRSLRLRADNPCCRRLRPDVRVTSLTQLHSVL